MIYNIQAETAHNNVAYTDRARYSGKFINGVMISYAVDTQDTIGNTFITVTHTGAGKPNDVLCKRSDIAYLRAMSDFMGGQSVSATTNAVLKLDFGYVDLSDGSQIEVVVEGAAIVNATMAIDVVFDNYNPTIRTKYISTVIDTVFTVKNCNSIFLYHATAVTEDGAINLSGDIRESIVIQSAWRYFASSGLADTPGTTYGLLFHNGSLGGYSPSVTVQTTASGLVFTVVSNDMPRINLAKKANFIPQRGGAF